MPTPPKTHVTLRLIREYKASTPRTEGQSADDRRGLRAEMEALAQQRVDAIVNGWDIPKAR